MTYTEGSWGRTGGREGGREGGRKDAYQKALRRRRRGGSLRVCLW